MLARKHVVQYARGSGISENIAERDIVLTYVLRVLASDVLSRLAFKGGTCLKKVYFGKTGRFSMDLDFTTVNMKLEDLKDGLRQLLGNRMHFNLDFKILDENIGDKSYLAEIQYKHAWNSGQFYVQVSYRETPSLPLFSTPLLEEPYFKYCEFPNFPVNCMQKEEVLAEKIRAAMQRVSCRDLYDLYLLAKTPYNKETTKKLAVVKCWNVRDPFNPKKLLDKVANESYNWDDLEKLVRKDNLPSQNVVIDTVCTEYAYLKNLDDQLVCIIKDSRSHKEEKLVLDILGGI